MGVGTISDSFTGFCDPTSHIGLLCPALIHGEELGLTATLYIDTHRNPVLSWIEMEEEEIREEDSEEEELGWRRRETRL